jgi:hypothetical protein
LAQLGLAHLLLPARGKLAFGLLLPAQFRLAPLAFREFLGRPFLPGEQLRLFFCRSLRGLLARERLGRLALLRLQRKRLLRLSLLRARRLLRQPLLLCQPLLREPLLLRQPLRREPFRYARTLFGDAALLFLFPRKVCLPCLLACHRIGGAPCFVLARQCLLRTAPLLIALRCRLLFLAPAGEIFLGAGLFRNALLPRPTVRLLRLALLLFLGQCLGGWSLLSARLVGACIGLLCGRARPCLGAGL